VIRNVYPNASVVPIRFSFSKHNTTEEIDRVVELVAGLINKQ
jgi:cysteine sulfinate desulfinase/cysteine desulfurase-like protein